ncbi:MAG: putative CRISPR-associated protein [Candidatus Nitrosocaldus sp.]
MSMGFTLLVTCGTSLLNNAGKDAKSRPQNIGEEVYNRLVEIDKKYDLSRLARLDPKSIEDNEIRDKHTFAGSELFQALLNYIKERGGRDASAEVNTIELLMHEQRILASDVDDIFLYHSDTGTGTLCARVIEEYLRSKGLKVERVEVKGFSSAKTLGEFQEGMMDLMSKVVKVVKKRKRSNHDSKVYILATAGFKPESTAAVIAALLAGADGIYYVYESTRELVMIPPIPLAISEWSKKSINSIFGADYKNDISMDILLARGIPDDRITMLEERGLIERKGVLNNKIRLRDWVKELLD